MIAASDDVVKSAGRVFAVLELFDEARTPLSATEVVRRLSFPQSSTVALLKTMVSLGYLAFDQFDRRYLPTMRVPIGDTLGSESAIAIPMSRFPEITLPSADEGPPICVKSAAVARTPTSPSAAPAARRPPRCGATAATGPPPGPGPAVSSATATR